MPRRHRVRTIARICFVQDLRSGLVLKQACCERSSLWNPALTVAPKLTCILCAHNEAPRIGNVL